jgi:hypothetical protein
MVVAPMEVFIDHKAERYYPNHPPLGAVKQPSTKMSFVVPIKKIRPNQG